MHILWLIFVSLQSIMMNWQQLISNKRLGQEHRHPERHDDRTEFKRDYDRLIFSAPFRRLQNKTQVFPLPGSIFVHNRLTHSLEVSCVGMSLGNDVAQQLLRRHPELSESLLGEIGQIVATACLAHDMGNPPFGHSGEKAIQSFFTEGPGMGLQAEVSPQFWCDVTHFEGNANAFRLLTHQFCGRRTGGFVMTYSTLASIVKYPFSSMAAGKKGKFGFFDSEKELFVRIASELGMIRKSVEGEPLRYARHPLVYLVEAADDICYEIMDIEDAHKLKIISYENTSQMLLSFFDSDARERILQRIVEEGVTDKNEKVVYLRACVIGLLESECVRVFVEHEDEIMEGRFNGSLIDNISPRPKDGYKRCSDLAFKKLYRAGYVVDVDLAGIRIINLLLDKLTQAVLHPETNYSQLLLNKFPQQYDVHATNLFEKIQGVLDHISAMTDVYALNLYRQLDGISLPTV